MNRNENINLLISIEKTPNPTWFKCPVLRSDSSLVSHISFDSNMNEESLIKAFASLKMIAL